MEFSATVIDKANGIGNVRQIEELPLKNFNQDNEAYLQLALPAETSGFEIVIIAFGIVYTCSIDLENPQSRRIDNSTVTLQYEKNNNSIKIIDTERILGFNELNANSDQIEINYQARINNPISNADSEKLKTISENANNFSLIKKSVSFSAKYTTGAPTAITTIKLTPPEEEMIACGIVGLEFENSWIFASSFKIIGTKKTGYSVEIKSRHMNRTSNSKATSIQGTVDILWKKVL